MSLRVLLVVILVLFLLGGGFGFGHYGVWAMSPFGLLLLVVIALIVAGIV